jgi:hypothetical protein
LLVSLIMVNDDPMASAEAYGGAMTSAHSRSLSKACRLPAYDRCDDEDPAN